MIREQFDLSDKVALVVGARGLLGRRFCVALGEFGARVFAADLSEASCPEETGNSTFSANTTVQRAVDVTDPDSVKTLVDGIIGEAGQIDVLVYSVTTKPKDFYEPFTNCSLEGWQALLRTELDGLFLVSQQVGKFMESAGKGSIIFLGSIYGIVGNDQRIYTGANLDQLYANVSGPGQKQLYAHAGYAAAKGAVMSLTRYLAAYWGSSAIRVNCVSPGGVVHPGENRSFVRRYSRRVPLARKATLDEISGAIVYLASDASSYVTGHNLVIDGGWTAW